MKLVIALTMLAFAQFSFALDLKCQSTSGMSFKAQLEDDWALQGYELSQNGRIITASKKYIPASKSYDMFQSRNFTDNLPYFAYMIGQDINCTYRFSLPNEDLRDYTFVALVTSWGRQCPIQEVELLCKTSL